MKVSLISNKFIKDLNINCFHYCYDNKLNVMYVEDESYAEKIDFSITMLTPAINNKGITHIIEHCIASEINNKKFLEQYARNIQDRTCYEYILHIDDINEIKGIVNEVFFPKFKVDKNIFLREGWRIDSEKAKFFIRGIVYNEMIESFTSPIYNIVNYIPYTLFNKSNYKNISGGIPKEILDLQLDDLINYHNKYYKINNCVIYVHGYKCIDNIMEIIHSVAQDIPYYKFDDVDKIKPEKMIDTCNLKINYPAIKENSNTFMSINYVVNKPINQFQYNVYYQLMNLILKNQEKLKSSGKDIRLKDIQATFKNLVYVAYFSVVLNGQDLESYRFMEEYDRFLLDLVQDISECNIPNYVGYDVLNNSLIDGLNLGRYIAEAFFSNLNPFIYLYDNISNEEKNSFIKYMNEQLIKSPAKSNLLVIPKCELLRENFIKKALNNGVINEYHLEQSIINNNDDFRSLKNVEIYKNKTSKSINSKVKVIRLSDQYNIDCYMYNANNLMRIHFYFDITNLNHKQHIYLSAVINYLEDKMRISIDEEIKFFIYPVNDKECKLILRINSMEDRLEKLMNSIIDIFNLSDLEKDKIIIENIINKNLTEFDIDIFRNTIFYLDARVTAHISLAGFCKDCSLGIGNYKFFKGINEIDILQELRSTLNLALLKNDLKVSIYAKNQEYVLKIIRDFIYKLKSGGKQKSNFTNQIAKREGIIYSFETNYVAQSFNVKELGIKNCDKNNIIFKIIADNYFVPMIRQKNNAYGCGILNKDNYTTFYSMRDPNIESTLEVFKGTYNYIMMNIDSIYTQYNLYKRNYIHSIKDPIINEKNDRATLKNVFKKSLKCKSDVINDTEGIDREYIERFAEVVRIGVDERIYSVIGSEKNINDTKEIYEYIYVL